MAPGAEPTNRDKGAALIVALMAMTLLLALGLMLVLNTAMDVTVAGNFHAGQEAFYAADAALDRAAEELRRTSDWSAVLDGSAHFKMADTGPLSTRRLPDGSIVDLEKAAKLLTCGSLAPCSAPEGAWRLYSDGPLGAILSSPAVHSNMFVAVWVREGPSEVTGEQVGGQAITAGPASVLLVHAEAFGPGGTHRVVEAAVSRPDPTASNIRLFDWRELR